MSSEANVSSQQKTLDEMMKRLDAFANERKVANVNMGPDFEELLDYDRTALRKMTAEDCGENAALLSKYAYYIQQLSNQENISLNLAEECLRGIIGKHYANYKQRYDSKDEVEMKIINDNDAAKEYNRLRVLAKARLGKLSYLANRVQNMANAMQDLQQSKRQRRYE